MTGLTDTSNIPVLRIVYDGPPGAGKSAAVHALQQILAPHNRVVSSPEENGHSCFFDWLDCQTGNTAHFQVLATPGQPSLQERRHFLLKNADAIVFVVDSRSSEIALALEYFQDLQELLESTGTTLPLMIQANKQDLPGILGADMLAMFFPAECPMVTTDALARPQELADSFARFAQTLAAPLAGKRPAPKAFENPEALLAHMESIPPTTNEANRLLETLISPDEERSGTPVPDDAFNIPVNKETGQALLPDPNTPPLWVYPNSPGFDLLEAISSAGLTSERQQNGVWVVPRNNAPEWHCISLAEWVYEPGEEAKQAFRRHMQAHIRWSPLLAPERCVALAAHGKQQRLWQICHHESLAGQADTLLPLTDPEDFAAQLFYLAKKIYQACQNLSRFVRLEHLTLDNLALQAQSFYLGPLNPDDKIEYPVSEANLVNHVLDLLAPSLAQALEHPQTEVTGIAGHLREKREEAPLLTDALCELIELGEPSA